MATSRIQLALNVSDLEAAVRFYEDLFGVAAAKRRPGYVNFAIDDPPLKLVLLEAPEASSPLNHLGVELASTDDVTRAAERLAGVGLSYRVSEQERCCHAVQDKVWVDAPEVPLGAWELYTVLADDPDQAVACDHTVCCTGGAAAGGAAAGGQQAARETEQEEAGPCCG